MQFRTIEIPDRKDDVPGPRIKAVRRVDLPDGKSWIDVLGGYSHEERRFWQMLMDEMMKLPEIKDEGKREQAENDVNAYMATFLDLHLIDHNLTHGGTDEPLPKGGFDLFWDIPTGTAIQICRLILTPPSPFDLPKAEASSSTG